MRELPRQFMDPLPDVRFFFGVEVTMCPFAIALRILAIAFIATASLHLMFGLYADANPTNAGFILIITVLEIVWVLRSLLKQHSRLAIDNVLPTEIGEPLPSCITDPGPREG